MLERVARALAAQRRSRRREVTINELLETVLKLPNEMESIQSLTLSRDYIVMVTDLAVYRVRYVLVS
jgi:nitrogen-specific signal transduction histidine kinase